MVRRSRRSVAEEEEDPNAAHELDEGRRRNKGKGAAQSSSQLSQEPGEDDGDDSGIEVLDSSDDEEANARVLADAQAAAAAAGAALFHEMDVSCLEAPQDDQEPQPTDFRPVIDTLRAQLKLLTKAAKKYEPPHRGYKQGKTERERRRRIRPDDWIQSDDEDDDEDDDDPDNVPRQPGKDEKRARWHAVNRIVVAAHKIAAQLHRVQCLHGAILNASEKTQWGLETDIEEVLAEYLTEDSWQPSQRSMGYSVASPLAHRALGFLYSRLHEKGNRRIFEEDYDGIAHPQVALIEEIEAYERARAAEAEGTGPNAVDDSSSEEEELDSDEEAARQASRGERPEDPIQDSDEDFDEIAMVDDPLAEWNFKDPLTKTWFDNPHMSVRCKHTFSLTSIQQYLRGSGDVGKSCPVQGCRQMVTASALVPDTEKAQLLPDAIAHAEAKQQQASATFSAPM